MKEKTSNFNRKKERALGALLTESTLGAAAKVAGISESTLWRWLKEQEFAEAYRELKREAVGQAVTRLQQISCQAVETLRTIMLNKKSPASVRVSAAKSIIEMAVKSVEIEDISRRLEELEKIIEKGEGKK